MVSLDVALDGERRGEWGRYQGGGPLDVADDASVVVVLRVPEARAGEREHRRVHAAPRGMTPSDWGGWDEERVGVADLAVDRWDADLLDLIWGIG